jgi:NADPH-dependent 2,4-dienoyl-CoA reductase/sulfur reductase-like enzyme
MTMPDADVLVVGGGPAGVAAALSLRRAGVARVTLLDREPSLGGATRHCSHSPFGMREFGRVLFGPAYGRRLERAARDAGVTVLSGHSVVSLGAGGALDITHPGGTGTLTARRVVLATGAREMPRSARLLPGDRPVGVLTTGALQAFVAFHGLMPFRRPVILGSELVSLSAALTCLTHGARPVAMVEPGDRATARAPLGWFPRLAGVPFLTGARILDIRGTSRVEAVVVAQGDRVTTLDCDGLLVTGSFTPEASLLRLGGHGVDGGSGGPLVDQDGRCANPLYFAAGNLLRPVETGGWSYREGWAIGTAVARDLLRDPADAEPIPVTHDAPVKLVVPNILRRGPAGQPGLDRFQLRFARRCSGVLSLSLDGRRVWQRRGTWLPERRVLIPMPAGAAMAAQVHVGFAEEP